MLGVVGTLSIGLGLFAVVYTVVQKILIESMPYDFIRNDLYFAWRDYGPILDLKRGWLGGPDIAELQKAGSVIENACPASDDSSRRSRCVKAATQAKSRC